MTADGQLAPGATIAERYRVSRILGEGGMGVVYAAEHMLMRKEVALKVLHADMCSMPEIVARFEREAIAAAAIDHANVAGATDFGRLPDGSCYLVLELLKGSSLRDEIAKGPMSLERALIILRGIANGVAAAHAKGIVHRDLKPENVMLVEKDGLPDFVKVLDFGIAKLDPAIAESPRDGQNIVTRVGTIFGTPEYMAPEQAVGDKVDARADIFALGVLFLEMLTGKCPFKGEVLMVLRERILMTTPIDMSAIESDAVKALIKKMMERMPEDRVQSASDLLAVIDQLEMSATAPAVTRNITASQPDQPTTARSLRSEVGMLAEEAPSKRPKWLIPGGIASAAGLVLVVVAFGASGGDKEMKGEATVVTASASFAINVPADKHRHPTPIAKHAPPPAEVESAAPPEPSASASAEAPADSASAASSASADSEPTPSATASHQPAAPTHPWLKGRPARKTGPGGIYIPPPKEWFK